MKRILIVEDELLIAKHIKFQLEQHGYKCVGIALDYSGALEILNKKQIDLALLDIKISGLKDGIDLAKYINANFNIPFMFITSFNDKTNLQKIKITKPVGYLNKPINNSTLITNLDLFFNSLDRQKQTNFILEIGTKSYKIDFSKLVYIEADHVYVKLHFKEHIKTLRCSLSSILSLVNHKDLVQVNRGIAVNRNFVTEVGKNYIMIQDVKINVSKSYIVNTKTSFFVEN